MAAVSFYTVVQHSGCGYGGDGTFRQGLESRHIDNAKDRDLVLRAGGVLFGTYTQAEDYCMEEMYREAPPGAFTIVPQAPGDFSEKEIDGLRVYVPKVKPQGQGVVR